MCSYRPRSGPGPTFSSGKIHAEGRKPDDRRKEKLSARQYFGEKDVRTSADTSMRIAARHLPATIGSKSAYSNRHGVEKETSAPWPSSVREIERPGQGPRRRAGHSATAPFYGPPVGHAGGQVAIAGPKGFKKGSEVNADNIGDYPRFASGGPSQAGGRKSLAGRNRSATWSSYGRFQNLLEISFPMARSRRSSAATNWLPPRRP